MVDFAHRHNVGIKINEQRARAVDRINCQVLLTQAGFKGEGPASVGSYRIAAGKAGSSGERPKVVDVNDAAESAGTVRVKFGNRVQSPGSGNSGEVHGVIAGNTGRAQGASLLKSGAAGDQAGINLQDLDSFCGGIKSQVQGAQAGCKRHSTATVGCERICAA